MNAPRRPLRVLHIGNVANYAYNIGKILQTDDIESHVVTWDYYHINAQPVWEEGVFDASSIGDHFFPKLPNASVTGFRKPTWFVQGPRLLACLTLIARNEGQTAKAAFFQRRLDKHLAQLHDPAYREGMSSGRQRFMEAAYVDLLGGFQRHETLAAVRRLTASLPHRALSHPVMLRLLGPRNGEVSAQNRADALKWAILARFARLRIGAANRADAAKWMILGRTTRLRLRAANWANAAKWAILGRTERVRVRAANRANGAKCRILHLLDLTYWRCRRAGAKLPAPLKKPMKSLVFRKRIIEAPPRGETSGHFSRSLDGPVGASRMQMSGAPSAPVESNRNGDSFEAHVQALIAQYKAIYPDREFDPSLLRQYEHTLPLMRRLFGHYDLIIGYSIEGIWPLMAGFPYVSYEFGTIRNIPFEDTPTGRLGALCYRNCEQTIVTNCDNEAPAKRLGRPYFFLPHVVNESGLLTDREAESARAAFIAEHGGDFIVFHPPRQHWSEARDTNWDKGNDRLWHGFARFVKTQAPNARCIAVAWGDTLPGSKALIEELGVTANVVWITPQPHVAMMRYICLCDVVCDQFTIPTFGGIPPKAFHAGKPVVTSFDPALHHWCFEELPPLIPADSAEMVHDALARLHGEKAFAAELGRKGADWYRRENSNARVREVLLQKLHGLGARGQAA